VKTCVRFGAVVLTAFLACEARAACTVAATGINFGSYDVFVTAPRDSTGSVTVSCDQSPPTDVTVAIGPSATSGGFNPRMMRHASRPDRLNYHLFTNPSMNVIWGDGTAGTSTVLLPRVKKNKPEIATIYGRILPGQDVSVGSYSDRLTVTITP
jgi:spore coat protein U-like protein